MRKLPSEALPLTVLFSCSFGTLFELYDFTLYVILLENILSPLFFPHSDPFISYALGMMSFIITFIFAPLGSLFWGWFADKHGRKKMLFFTLFFMGGPSFLIGCLPTYAHIGIAAPFLLIICRLLQSFSASGEVTGAKIYAMEQAGPKKIGFYSGCISACGSLGVLLALTIAGNVAPHSEAWRIPFLVGGACMTLLAVARFKNKSFLPKEPSPIENTSFSFFSKKKEFVTIFVLAAFLGVLSYMLFGFMTSFLIKFNGMKKEEAHFLSVCGMGITMFSSIIAGKAIDKIGVVRLLLPVMCFVFFLSIPLFTLLLHSSFAYKLLGQFFLNASLGIFAASCTVVFYYLFPYDHRCRGILFPYAMGVSLLGSTTPLFCRWAVQSTGYLYIPALWLSLWAAASFWVLKINQKKLQEKNYDALY